MKKTLRIVLLILFGLSSNLSLAGERFAYQHGYYQKNKWGHWVWYAVNPNTITNHNSSVTYNFYGQQSVTAQQGATQYLPQTVMQALLKVDQGDRYLEQGYAVKSQGQQLQAGLASQALGIMQQSADAQEFLQFLGAFTQYKLALRGADGQQGPLPLQAPQSPLQAFVSANCIQCHGPAQQSGGLDFSKADELPYATLKAMNKAIATGKMPKGRPLPPEAKAGWCEIYTGALEAGIDGAQNQPPAAPDPGVPQGRVLGRVQR